MKSMRLLHVAILGVALLLPLGAQAQQSKIDLCRKASTGFTKWVLDSRETAKKHKGLDEEVQRNIAARTPDYGGLTNRMAARANTLLTTGLNEPELLADLYGLCMAIA